MGNEIEQDIPTGNQWIGELVQLAELFRLSNAEIDRMYEIMHQEDELEALWTEYRVGDEP